MHALHEYIARQVSERLKDHRIVVMYDPRNELPMFFEEACGAASALMRTGTFASRKATVCSFQGSFLEVRSAVEPLTSGEDIDDLVVYVPGIPRDEKTSLLLEIEKAGDCYLPPAAKQMARNVLRKRFTDVAIDEMLSRDSWHGQRIGDALAVEIDDGLMDGLVGLCHAASGLRYSQQPSSQANEENQLPRVSIPT